MKLTVKQSKPKRPPKKYVIELDEDEAREFAQYLGENTSNLSDHDTVDWRLYRAFSARGVIG